MEKSKIRILLLIDERIKKIKRQNEGSLEKQGEKIGECLHLIYRDIRCLEHYYSFFKGKESAYKGVKYLFIFNYFVRIFWDRIYVNIYQILDANKDVLSLKNFFIKCGQKVKWKEIEKNDVFKKIKSNRHNLLAHKNFVLTLHPDDRMEHYNKNKLYLLEILDFMNMLQKQFEAVFDKVVDIPVRHFALGKSKEEQEFRDLLVLVFSNER